MPLSESLPFYHCRIAMFVMLLIPGTSSTNSTTLYFEQQQQTLFDPYPFPHVTILSFIIGHVALLGNALLSCLEASAYWFEECGGDCTFALNGLIWVVNLVVEWGLWLFKQTTPLVGSFGQPLNYLIVSRCYSISNSLNREISRKFCKNRKNLFKRRSKNDLLFWAHRNKKKLWTLTSNNLLEKKEFSRTAQKHAGIYPTKHDWIFVL